MKKVSIITATYNLNSRGYRTCFYESFRSIHEQDYPNIEHIIVDGGSQDGSLEYIKAIADRYGKKEIKIISEPDKGINDATNKGFRNSTGDYITLMCDDDFYTRPYSISKMVETIEKSGADFGCADCWWSNLFVWRADLSHFASYNPPCLINTMLIKREILEKEPYYLPIEFPMAADWDLQFRLMTNENIKGVEVHEPLTILRPNGFAQTDYSQVKKEIGQIFKRHFGKVFSESELYNMHLSKASLLTLYKIKKFCKNKQIKDSVFRTYNKKEIKRYIRKNLEYYLFFKFIYAKNKKFNWTVPPTHAEYGYNSFMARQWVDTFYKELSVTRKINVVIPMAGAGSRFEKAGYDIPKPFIEFKGKMMIEHVLNSFKSMNANFVLVLQERFCNEQKEQLEKLKQNYNIDFVTVPKLTMGAAITALASYQKINPSYDIIFADSDNIFNENDILNFVESCRARNLDGALLTFNSKDSCYSYAKIDNNGMLIETREKEVISNHAISGVYYFKELEKFKQAVIDLVIESDLEKGEFYMSCVYNHLKKFANNISIYDIEHFDCVGTPEQLNKYLQGEIYAAV